MEATKQLGLDGKLFEILSLISVNRTPTSVATLGEPMNEKERQALRNKYRGDRTPEQVRVTDWTGDMGLWACGWGWAEGDS